MPRLLLPLRRTRRRRRIERETTTISKTFTVEIPSVPSSGFVDLDDIIEVRKFLPLKRLVILNNSVDSQTIVYIRKNAHVASPSTPDTYTIRALGYLDDVNAGISNFAWYVGRPDGRIIPEGFTLNVTVYA